jgi:hypothetical protein
MYIQEIKPIFCFYIKKYGYQHQQFNHYGNTVLLRLCTYLTGEKKRINKITTHRSSYLIWYGVEKWKKSEKIGFSSVLHERRDTISIKVTTYIFHDSVFFFLSKFTVYCPPGICWCTYVLFSKEPEQTIKRDLTLISTRR